MWALTFATTGSTSSDRKALESGAEKQRLWLEGKVRTVHSSEVEFETAEIKKMEKIWKNLEKFGKKIRKKIGKKIWKHLKKFEKKFGKNFGKKFEKKIGKKWEKI